MISRLRRKELQVMHKILNLPKLFLVLMIFISCVGFALLYSAAKGNFDPWAAAQMKKFIIGFIMMIGVAIIDIRIWFRFSYLFYGFGLLLLVMVKVIGVEGGLGAQRWLNIGGFQFQPSELMKVFMVLALARYFHSVHYNNINRIATLIVPALLIGSAAGLILMQPNLGTALITMMMSVMIVFVAGVSWKKFAIAGIIAILMLPVVWANMHNYQKERVYTFLDPERDPLGKGYNIIQSKIAIGSGGIFGKGFTEGTQSQLSFVPERQTDFIFSIVAEEFGLAGAVLIILLYAGMIISAIKISANSENVYGSLIAYGVISVLFLHVFINIGMVMGILPVVGVPLPLLSYGGSSMISNLIGFGFILNAHIHRKLNFA